MTASEFTTLLTNQQVDGLTQTELESLLRQYPFCQPLRFVLLKKYFEGHHPDRDTHLNLAATYASDRSFLFKMLADPTPEEGTVVSDQEEKTEDSLAIEFAPSGNEEELVVENDPNPVEGNIVFDDPVDTPDHPETSIPDTSELPVSEESVEVLESLEELNNELQEEFIESVEILETPEDSIDELIHTPEELVEAIINEVAEPEAEEESPLDLTSMAPEDVKVETASPLTNEDAVQLDQPDDYIDTPLEIIELGFNESEIEDFLETTDHPSLELKIDKEGTIDLSQDIFPENDQIAESVKEKGKAKNEKKNRKKKKVEKSKKVKLASFRNASNTESEVSFVSWLSSLPSTPFQHQEEKKPKKQKKSKPKKKRPKVSEKKPVQKKKKVNHIAEQSLEDHFDNISDTLADLLALQGNKTKAIAMYEQLILKFPEKSTYFAVKIEKLKS
ncbi:MAG: tetratricopeptide repeat protein [Bacteroidota bacterium]